MADFPKELEEIFCIICKSKLRFVAGCKSSLAFADNLRVKFQSVFRNYSLGEMFSLLRQLFSGRFFSLVGTLHSASYLCAHDQAV